MHSKETVRRFIDEAINGGREELINELFTPDAAGHARQWFGAFRRSFPDLRMDTVQLVAEGDTVVGRFACSASHRGEWRGHPPTGRSFENIDEVYFFTFSGDRIATIWGIEDTLGRFHSSASTRAHPSRALTGSVARHRPCAAQGTGPDPRPTGPARHRRRSPRVADPVPRACRALGLGACRARPVHRARHRAGPLGTLRERKLALLALVFAPSVFLVPLAWGVSRLFAEPVREGVLALGVSSTEIAAVGLVALAGGSAVLALGALTGSLVVAALAGPPLLSLLAGGTDVAVAELVGRFALVVLLPLAVGLGARALAPPLERHEPELAGIAALILLVLVYQAMSGASADGQLESAALASTLFLAGSAAPVLAWVALAAPSLRVTGALVIPLRDFAVAAALAAQAFGPPAATVAGIYGVLMLIAGVVGARLLPTLSGAQVARRRRDAEP